MAILTTCCLTFVDLNEIHISSLAPVNPTNNQIWFDTSLNVVKKYNSSTGKWEIINDYSEEIKDAIDNLQVTGKNLLANTDTSKDILCTGAAFEAGATFNFTKDINYLNDIKGKQITLAFDWEYIGDNPSGIFYAQTVAPQLIYFTPKVTISSSKKYGTQLYTTTIKSSQDTTGIEFVANNITGTIRITHPRIFLGSKDLGWSQAPEDIENKFQTIFDRTSKGIYMETSGDGYKSLVDINNKKIKIASENITLEGYTTINKKFVIDEEGKLTATDANFSGSITSATLNSVSIYSGSIKIGGNFSVDHEGNMKAKNASFTGTIKAGSDIIGATFTSANEKFKVLADGTIEATDGKFSGTITSSTIAGGSIGIGGSLNNNFVVDSSGNIVSKGTANLAKGNFVVDSNGNITAKNITSTNANFSGNINSSTIKGGSIGIGGTDNSNFSVDTNGNIISKGTANLAKGNFIVSSDGNITAKNITATNASFTGTIKSGSTITGATFTSTNNKFKVLADGTIEAVGGKFSGTITGSNITGGTIGIGGTDNSNFVVDSNGSIVSKGTANLAKGNFVVDTNGNIIAKNITATSANFSGNINSSTIRGGTIGIGGTNNNNFTVDSSGNIISKGTANLANGNFVVDTSGNITTKNITATNGKFSGQITGSTISTTSGKFSVDSNGIMKCSDAVFSGAIKGSTIATNSNKFSVDSNGIMRCSGAIIDGTFKTSSTEITIDNVISNAQQGVEANKEINNMEIGTENYILNTSFTEKEDTYSSDGSIVVKDGTITVSNATTLKMNLAKTFGVLKTSNDIVMSAIATQASSSSIGLNKLIGGNIDVYSENHPYIVDSIKKLNLNVVTVPVAVTIANETSSNPYVEDWAINRTKAYLDNLSEAKLINADTYLIFEPHPIINGGLISETSFNPSNKSEFFSKWKTLISDCITTLNKYKFYGIYIGTNFEKFDSSEQDLVYWDTLCKDLRTLFNNHKLIYRTNWWTTATWDEQLKANYNKKLNNSLWSKVDIISIAAYFELNENKVPTVDQLYEDITKGTSIYGRGQNIYQEVKNFYDKWKKPIMFGELGCPSKEYGASSPWNNLTSNINNETVQANLFEAYNKAFIYENSEFDNSWFLGYSIFTLGTSTTEYDLIGKQSQSIISKAIDFINSNATPYIKCQINDKVSNKTIVDFNLPLSHMMNSSRSVTTKLIYDATSTSEIIFNLNSSAIFTMTKPILSDGTKASSWTRSSEDLNNDIQGVKDNLENNYSTKKEVTAEIKKNTDSIVESVSEKYTTKTETNEKIDDVSLARREGKILYDDIMFKNSMNNILLYNNTSGSSDITVTRITKPSDCPTNSTHCIQVKHTGTNTSPNYGGFVHGYSARANAIFVQRFIAKVPTGYSLELHSNSIGDGSSDKWITSNQGIGKWKEYIRLVKCGSSGSFMTGGHISLKNNGNSPVPSTSKPIIWYIALAEVKDVTTDSEVITRVKNAENKLTKDGLTTIISDYYATSSDVDGIVSGKGYVTQAQVDTTVKGLQVKVSESGGYNLLKNSMFYNRGIDQWWYWGNAHTFDNLNYFLDTGDMWFGVEADNAGGLWQNGIELEPSTEYTMSVNIGWEANVKGAKFVIEYTSDKENQNQIHSQDLIFKNDYGLRQAISFTTPSNAKYAKMGFWHGGSSDGNNAFLIHINKPCLAKGIGSVWSPAPNEVYDGITTIDKDGVKVSMQDGEGAQGYTRIAHDGMEIFDSGGSRIAHFGDSNTAYIKSLTADEINNRWLLRWNEGRPKDLYVAPNATGDGTGRDVNNKANSITNALNWLWNNYGCYSWQTDIIVHLSPGDYWGADNYIGGWIGTGVLYIILEPWACIRSTIRIEECAMTVVIKGSVDPYNIEVQDNAYLYLNYDGEGIHVRNSTVVIAGLNIQHEGWYGDTNTWGNYLGIGVYATDGSNVLITNCDIVGFWYGCYSRVSSYVSMLNCVGHVGCAGTAIDGGILSFDRAIPIHKDWFWKQNGGFLWDSGGTWTANSKFYPKPEAPQPEPPPPVETWVWTENTFWAGSLWTTPEGSGSGTSGRSGVWGQGKWGSYKPHRGFASFSGVSAWCSGGRNFSVELTMTRQNTSHGYAGAVPVPKIKTTNGSFWNCGQAFARGAMHTITLPSDVANALANGSWTQLEMWAGTSTNDYSFYESVKIRVVCEKRVQ